MNVALLGFGTVGQSVARLLLDSSAPLTLTHIFNRDVARKRVDWVPADVRWTERFEDVLGPEVDIIVEVVGGLDPAGCWLRKALAAGKSVVTANKQLMAHEGGELLRLAAQHKVHLGFEAAVAGGIPVIRAIREGLAGDRLVRITGILNGTCNYMLTRMEADNLSFDAALARGAAAGFAEADPDRRPRRLRRARQAVRAGARRPRTWRCGPADVPCRSIRPLSDVDFVYAHRLGYTIRQVSRVERHDDGDGAEVAAAVEPALVRRGSVLSRVKGSENLVLTVGERGGETGFSGRGAGGDPTAVAVLSDVLSIVRHTSPPGLVPRRRRRSAGDGRIDSRAYPHYLRFVVRDEPGIIAVARHRAWRRTTSTSTPCCRKAAGRRTRCRSSSRSRPARREVVDRAIDEIAPLDFNVERPVCLPIVD